MSTDYEPGSRRQFKFCEEFSRLPGGRLKIHGPHSGQQFREVHLFPLLKTFEFIEFDLDGAAGFASGFLDEAFGEAGKVIGLNESQRRLKFSANDDPFVVEMIWEKIENANSERSG